MKFIIKIKKNFPRIFSEIKEKLKVKARRANHFIKQHPFRALFLTLFIFLFLMIIGNLFFAPKPPAKENIVAPKEAHIYKLGSAPFNIYQGKVEKGGVVKIVAQAPGIVQNINIYEGQAIKKGTNILSLSSNYSGGNVASIARQIAQTQYDTAKSTYDTQKDIISNQRKTVDNNRSNGDLLKQVIAQSTTDTYWLLDLQNTIVTGIGVSIANLEATNIGGINDAAILQSKQLLAQYQGAMLQTKTAFGNLQIQANQASGEGVALQYQIAQKQLDLQEKNLSMSLEIARLQYNMATVNEATMFPSAPFAGVIDKIFVNIGENVNPGTVLAQISGTSQTAEVVVSVSQDVAKQISHFEPSTLFIGKQTINMLPSFISQNATNGVLYSVIYVLDESLASELTENSYIKVAVPIGTSDTTNIAPFVPLDSVSQTQEEAFVYIVDNKNIARAKRVSLGQIQGRFVEVLDGLPANASVILDRNVIDGDRIKILN